MNNSAKWIGKGCTEPRKESLQVIDTQLASTSDKANVPNVSTSSKKLKLSRPSTSPKPNLDSILYR